MQICSLIRKPPRSFDSVSVERCRLPCFETGIRNVYRVSSNTRAGSTVLLEAADNDKRAIGRSIFSLSMNQRSETRRFASKFMEAVAWRKGSSGGTIDGEFGARNPESAPKTHSSKHGRVLWGFMNSRESSGLSLQDTPPAYGDLHPCRPSSASPPNFLHFTLDTADYTSDFCARARKGSGLPLLRIPDR